jgi:hypothetical protein
MTADDPAGSVDDGAGPKSLGDAGPEKSGVVVVGNETDLLAFRFLGDGQA